MNTSINQQEGCQKDIMAHTTQYSYCETNIKLYNMNENQVSIFVNKIKSRKNYVEIFWRNTGVLNDTSVQTD